MLGVEKVSPLSNYLGTLFFEIMISFVDRVNEPHGSVYEKPGEN